MSHRCKFLGRGVEATPLLAVSDQEPEATPASELRIWLKVHIVERLTRHETRGDFGEVLLQIEREAEEEGPAGVADLKALQFKYQLINALIQQRRLCGWTQKQLAERAGIGQAEVSKIERERKSPTIDTYARLATALGIAPGWPVAKSPGRRQARRAVPV
jgi:DNA-binding XRE family transcriptional regulator